MANLILADPEDSDAGTFYALSAASDTTEVENLRDMDPRTKYRSSGLSGVYIEIDFGAAYAWDTLALIGHNMTSAATWRIKAGASQGNVRGGSPSYDSGSGSVWTAAGKPSGYDGVALSSLFYPGTTQNYQWVRVELTDAGNGDGYIEAGRIIVDAAFQPTTNIQRPWGVQFVDPSLRAVTIAGGLKPYKIGKRRRFEIPLGLLPEADAFGTLYEFYRRRGTDLDVLAVRDPEATTYLHTQMVHGLMTDLRPIASRFHDRYNTRFSIEELV